MFSVDDREEADPPTCASCGAVRLEGERERERSARSHKDFERSSEMLSNILKQLVSCNHRDYIRPLYCLGNLNVKYCCAQSHNNSQSQSN